MSVALQACQSIASTVAPPSALYTVGGVLTGAKSPLTVQCNDVPMVVRSNGTFTCDLLYVPAQNYVVVVRIAPVGQACLVADGNGSVDRGPVTSIWVRLNFNDSIS